MKVKTAVAGAALSVCRCVFYNTSVTLLKMKLSSLCLHEEFCSNVWFPARTRTSSLLELLLTAATGQPRRPWRAAAISAAVTSTSLVLAQAKTPESKCRVKEATPPPTNWTRSSNTRPSSQGALTAARRESQPVFFFLVCSTLPICDDLALSLQFTLQHLAQ